MGLIARIGSRTVYLDANLFIYAVENVDPYARSLVPLFDALRAETVQAVTSEITLAEVLVHPLRAGDAEREAAFSRSVRTRDGLVVAPVSRAVLVEAARLRATTRMKLPDAIHAATARLSGCTVLLTNDAGIAAVAGAEVVRLSEAV